MEWIEANAGWLWLVLAAGLAGVELYKHIRYTVLWAWGISLVMLAAAMLFGVVTI